MKNWRITTFFVGLVCVLAGSLSGCDWFSVTAADVSGQPIVGHWIYDESVQEGDDRFYQRLYLHVREDGYVLYANKLCRTNPVSQSNSNSYLLLDYFPIKRITVKKMVLQKFPLTPKFELKLGEWPDQGRSVFEVDDLPLQAITSEQIPDYKSWECP